MPLTPGQPGRPPRAEWARRAGWEAVQALLEEGASPAPSPGDETPGGFAGTFPGAVALVARGDAILFHEAVGVTRIVPAPGVAVTAATRFDLASLSKPIATTAIALALAAAGRLDLDAPVGRYRPSFAAGGPAGDGLAGPGGAAARQAVTVRQLLAHASGLPAWLPLHERLLDAGRGAGVSTPPAAARADEPAGRLPPPGHSGRDAARGERRGDPDQGARREPRSAAATGSGTPVHRVPGRLPGGPGSTGGESTRPRRNREEGERTGPGAGPASARERAAALVDAMPLEALPGSRAEYSDLGFITLGAVLEAAGDAPLEELYRRLVQRPFGLAETDYAPAGAPKPWPPGTPVAATELSTWRGGVIEGEVHDDTAWAMGGVAGHAGLFGTARDVHRFAAQWLALHEGASGPIPRRLVAETFRRQGAPGTTRTLGWDTPSPGASSAGTRLAPDSIGHLGYSGTSMWIDPRRRLVAVLLTNRVHPTRENTRIRAFRPRFHDLVAAAFDSDPTGADRR